MYLRLIVPVSKLAFLWTDYQSTFSSNGWNMFNISRILDPIQSTIVLFMSLFPHGPKNAAPHRRRSRIVRNGDFAHTTGAKPQARKVLHRRQTRGIISATRSSSGSSANSWGVRDTDYYYHSGPLDKVYALAIVKPETRGSTREEVQWFHIS